MGENSAISWCRSTFNPWWGCTEVSPGCSNCYAKDFDKRVGGDHWHAKGPRRFLSDAYWRGPIKWNRLAENDQPWRVFCASMADVFEDRRDLDPWRHRLWQLIADTPNLTWLLLTKRPENIPALMPMWWRGEDFPKNVWLGTSVEDQRRADERVPRLLRVREHVAEVPVLFLSVEPLLEPVSLRSFLPELDWLPQLQWIILGGESGPKHRPFDANWARSIRDECAAAGVPFWFKQHGGRTHDAGGHLLDREVHQEAPASTVEVARLFA